MIEERTLKKLEYFEILNKISAIMTKENQKSGQSTQMRQKNPNFPGSGKEETPGTV